MNDFLMLSLIITLMIMSPGPDFAVVVKNSLAHGRMSGLGTACGIVTANLCHVTMNLLGIGLVIAESPMAFKVMQVLGAAYLMYLGYKGLIAKAVSVENGVQSLRAAAPLEATPLARGTQDHNGWYTGFLTGLLNPKACMFFLSFFSVLVEPSTALHTKVFYGLWICAIALLWFSTVALFFTNPVVSGRLQHYKHWLERVTGVFLIGLALKLLTSDIARVS